MTEVLKLPAYRRLLLAYGLTQVAWTVVEVALAILVYHRTGSAIGAAAFFLCAQFDPAFFRTRAWWCDRRRRECSRRFVRGRRNSGPDRARAPHCRWTSRGGAGGISLQGASGGSAPLRPSHASHPSPALASGHRAGV